jgi:hypothetical protein
MSLQTIDAPAKPAASALFTVDGQQLGRIHEPEVNLCVWQRTLPPALEQFIDRVMLPLAINRSVTLAANDLNLDLLLPDTPLEPGCAALRADIDVLSRLYLGLTDAGRIIIKLQSLDGILCDYFHTDWVRLRLICSYAGPGTQWLANEDVDRRRLAPDSGGLPDEASGLIHAGAAIQAIERFHVGLMKGEQWPGNRNRGLVHRSPRVADAAVRRILLKIESAP